MSRKLYVNIFYAVELSIKVPVKRGDYHHTLEIAY